ncbi:ATP-binding protein [Micromonospora rosaria]|uniref:ATP-binding protein n=1 Tax=Micromonospora rosaria TaxID=47874 RepID=UPI000B11AFB8|nr:tetratricopeptide repeat protein [Micromonospora rosaria]
MRARWSLLGGAATLATAVLVPMLTNAGSTLLPTDGAARWLAVGAAVVLTGLAALVEGRVRRSSRQPGEADPAADGSAAAGDPEVPRQLPAPPPVFTGRDAALAELDRALDRPAEQPTGVPATARMAVIIGTGGVGKTGTAVHWAHLRSADFPDGQLYVNLRGFDPTQPPMPAATALRSLLTALRVDPKVVPVDPDAQAALLRSTLAQRRMLVVADNARYAGQVEPLLPGTPTCAILVTSRHELPDLYLRGATAVRLDVLDPAGSRELITGHLGARRVDAEPAAVSELLGFCAGLPLAISIVAVRAVTRPRLPLREICADLRDESARLDGLGTDDLSVNVRAVISWSYRALDGDSARLFRLLGTAAGPDVGPAAAAALAAVPVARARTLLATLTSAHLVQEHVPGRYRMHDLIRLFAVEQPDPERTAAFRRLVDFYLHTALRGADLLDPHWRRVDVAAPVAGAAPLVLTTADAARSWFDAEYENLLATSRAARDQDWHRLVWQLAGTLVTHQRQQGHSSDYIDTWRQGLAAAEALDDPSAQAWAHRQLGQAYSRAEQHDRADEHLHRALTLAGQADDLACEAATRRSLARAWARRGDDRRALAHAQHALRLYRRLDPVSRARALNTVGWYLAQLHRYEQARRHCAEALALHRAHGYADGEALALDSLGYLDRIAGRHQAAVRHHRQAAEVFRRLGNAYKEADTLAHLAEAYAAAGQPDEARTAWRRAHDLYRAQRRHTQADRVRDRLVPDHRPAADDRDAAPPERAAHPPGPEG